MSTAKFCGLLHTHEPAIALAEVAKKAPERPVFHALLGTALKGYRTDKGWSIELAVRKARKSNHPALTPNKLRWLEEGKTKFPEQEVLRAVATIYGIDYARLASDFIAANYGRDLLGQSGTGSSGVPGGSDVPASVTTRLHELEARLARYDDLAPEIRSVLDKLVSITLAQREDAAVGKVAPGGRRSPRRAG